MQQPPVDLRMPRTEERDSVRALPDMAVVSSVAVVATLLAFIVLTMIHGEHEYHGDRAMTPEYKACFDAETDAAFAEMRGADYDHCKPVMPWYAAHPFWYALAIGAVVLVIGRGYVFMRRLEAGRGY